MVTKLVAVPGFPCWVPWPTHHSIFFIHFKMPFPRQDDRRNDLDNKKCKFETPNRLYYRTMAASLFVSTIMQPDSPALRLRCCPNSSQY